jgi:glycosyltransferase involved in cell wall biosynthesis
MVTANPSASRLQETRGAGARSLHRLCFVMPFHISERRGGGAEVQAWLLAKELARRGYDVHYLAQSVRGAAGAPGRVHGVTLHWVPYRAHLPWLQAHRWYAALRGIAPDVVIQRMTSEVTGVVGLYARRHRRAFAWICTGDAVPRRWFFLRRQAQANRAAAAGLLKGTVFLANALVRDLFRHYGMRYVTNAFTQNEGQRRDLVRAFGLASLPIPSGHEPPESTLDAETRRRNGLVLWAASLGRGKRPLLFGDLARLHERDSLRFALLGGHSDQAYAETVRGALPPNVECTGQLPFEEALRWFDQAAVLVNTSESEGFPNTFIQSWLRGVPVLTMGVDPDGIVRAHGLGRVAASVDEMSAALRELLADPDRYAALAAHVRKFARTHFTVERVADRFLEGIGAARAAPLTS